ncbi:MAG: ABC transporter permease subunit [Rhodospirillaceae bacterium]|nr:ABC transporter permease subunit [Rhodospirillaceae bacterium]MDD9999790.1 ABC transporter permease subunit [Rhodospirillaceae bacterium]
MSTTPPSRARSTAAPRTCRRGRRAAVSAFRIALLIAGLCGSWTASTQTRPIAIGSKNFTESYLLAEMMAQVLEERGFEVRRLSGLGGTLVAFQALQSGEIDAYPEYTGTLTQAILEAEVELDEAELDARLAPLGVELLPRLGFNNTYAIAVTGETASRFGLRRVSDLVSLPQLRFGFSHEFRDRADGWPGLQQRYGLPQTSSSIGHGLAYLALLEGEIDVTDAYSTDGDLLRYDLRVLEDDLGFFPAYHAAPLVRDDLDAGVKAALSALTGRLDDEAMRALNAEVVVEERTFAQVARTFLLAQGIVASTEARAPTLWDTLARNTLTHLKLTAIAVLAACVVGVGLALLVYRSPALSAGVLYVAGLLQTIPSIALLALMIPLAGVGQAPAIIALFLYSLLPIARNTITALITIDPLLQRVTRALGLTELEQLRHVYVPLALPHMLAGVRIAAVVSIGTATLAAFIGAGGLGEPIVTGLALNDTGLILQGAIPAALMALGAELFFEVLERRLVPRHLVSQHGA